MVPHDLNAALASIERIPALPAAVAKASRLCADGQAAASAIEQVFRSDEGLAASALHRANAVGHGGASERRFGLREAISRLGNRTLLRIALEHGAAGRLRDAGRCYGLERGALWRGSLGGAAVAERLAREERCADPDLAFSAALMRDIGTLALDLLAAGERASDWTGFGENRAFVEVERRRFGTDHAELGAALAERWSLPTAVVEAIRRHHQPLDMPADRLCDVVHAADCVARWSGLGVGDDGLMHPLSPRVRDELRLDRERVEALALHALEAVREAAADEEPTRRSA